MTEKKKVSKEDLTKMNDLRNGYQQIVAQLGQLELQINDSERVLNGLKEAKAQLLSQYENRKEEERKLLDSMNEKYGMGNVDLQTGEFTPMDTQQVPQVPNLPNTPVS